MRDQGSSCFVATMSFASFSKASGIDAAYAFFFSASASASVLELAWYRSTLARTWASVGAAGVGSSWFAQGGGELSLHMSCCAAAAERHAIDEQCDGRDYDRGDG